MDLHGIYLGTVEKNTDPELLGRVKVRVPHVYGVVGSSIGAVTVDNLPWAIPYGMPAGGTEASGGISWIPEPGDQVIVQFLDGEPEKPVWAWCMQTIKQAQQFSLHQYSTDEEDDTVSGVARSILTRYGHSLEFTETQLTLTTDEGYQVLLVESEGSTGGSAALQTPAGQYFILNDLDESAVVQALTTAVISAPTVALNAPDSVLIKTTRYSLTVGSTLLTIPDDGSLSLTTESGATVLIDADGNVAMASAESYTLSLDTDRVQLGCPDGTGFVLQNGQISATGEQMVFNTAALSVGTSEGYPVMLMTEALIAWVLGHTHLSGPEGSPTGPPIPLDVAFPQDSASQTLQTT